MRPHDLFSPGKSAYEPPLDDATLLVVESALAVKLPQAYVDLCREHNGGLLALDAFPVASPTTWAADHVGLYSVFAIGHSSEYSLCGTRGSRFWIEEWGYPEIGVYFADCPSAGHDMLALDYRDGEEPAVVHVDQEVGYVITLVAPSFAAFIEGLRPEDSFDSA